MFLFSTEVTSSSIQSDNPLYQRTLKAYKIVEPLITGKVLEIGCGEGYGINMLAKQSDHLTVIDKSDITTKPIALNYPEVEVINTTIPPIKLDDNTFDTIVSFQVIEHIKDEELFVKEIYRILKPGGKAYISTPNSVKTIVRNPWHYREYTYQELDALLSKVFKQYTIQGIQGNDKTKQYYNENEHSVKKILKFDVLKLHDKLPASALKIPYEILNRVNRKRLLKQHKDTVLNITSDDYVLNGYCDDTLDHFCILEK